MLILEPLQKKETTDGCLFAFVRSRLLSCQDRING